MSLPETIFEKLSLKDLGRHLANYLDLYIKPLTVWRKIISNRTTSYNLLILHIVYYALFTFLFIEKEIIFSIAYVIVEIGLTVIPFLIFLIPFLLFIKISNKKIKWTRLFRLFVILKLQFLPIVVLIVLFAKWSETESPLLLLDNTVWLLWISLIILLPLIMSLKIWFRAVWIIVNYVFFILFFVITSLLIERLNELEPLFEKLSINTPNGEFRNFSIKHNHSDLFIEDKYFLMIFRIPKKDKLEFVRAQFVTMPLYISFKQTKINFNSIILKRTDSLRKVKDTVDVGKNWIDSLTLYPKSNELTLAKLDSFKNSFDEIFFSDFKLTKQLKDSATYKSNRHHFQLYYDYLNNYQIPFHDLKKFFKIRNSKKIETVLLDNDHVGFMYQVDSMYYYEKKRDYLASKKSMENRTDKADFIMTILFYPVDLILDTFGFYD